jgi:hypothetical protein
MSFRNESDIRLARTTRREGLGLAIDEGLTLHADVATDTPVEMCPYLVPHSGCQEARCERATLSDLTDEGGQVAAYIATYLLLHRFEVAGWRDMCR